MANSRYAIPYEPLDFSGLPGIVEEYQRASLNRDKNARESAEEYRKGEEFKAALEDRKRKQDIERIAAFQDAKRMAATSPEFATSLYKGPFGFSFEKRQDLRPTEEGPQLSPIAEAQRFEGGGHPLGPMGAAAASINGIQDAVSPEVDAVSGGAFVPPAPPPSAARDLMPMSPEPPTRLYADIGNGPVEVPSSSGSATGLGPEADREYDILVNGPAHLDTREAFNKVWAQVSADRSAKASEERMRALFGQKDTEREDRQRQQDAHDRLMADEAMKRTLIMARAAGQRAEVTAPTPASVMAALADFRTKNPGDARGLYALADALDVKNPQAAIAGVEKVSGTTEGEKKDARQAAIGLRAIDEIKGSGYTPNREEVQKWLNNSRMVHLADKDSLIGGIASVGQTLDMVPQSEVEGLSPAAQSYFANVRRFMETIGRAQSGAAISPSEWTNFFNQYGPNSRGGMEAAEKYLSDQLQVSGAAGRQLDASGSVPRRGGQRGAMPKGIPAGSSRVPGKTGPNGRPAWRAPNGSLHEEDE